jgi:hypothetical protein
LDTKFIEKVHKNEEKKPFSIFHPLTFISNIYMLFINNNKQNLESHNYRVMVFKLTFNNISVISWWSILLVDETRIPGENHGHIASVIIIAVEHYII